MAKSSVVAVHGSSPSINGKNSEIDRSQQDGLCPSLHQDGAAPRSSLQLYDPTEPVNSRLQNPLYVAQPARDAALLHPTASATTTSTTVLKDTISSKDLAGVGDQFLAERSAESSAENG